MPLNINPETIGFNERGDGLFALPFQEQIAFFKGKAGLLLPSEHFDDVLKAAHDRAFMAAGAAKADLLADLCRAVQKTIDDGGTLEAFRKDFASAVQKHGWDYTGPFDWRTRVVYQTNLSASYAAGRWAQLTHPDLLKSRPYWQYIHNDSVAHPRPLHVKWSGLALRHDDPWWRSHFPPNGYGCRCRVRAVREPAPGKDAAPDDGAYDYVDRWGEPHRIPNGIDYGWDYAPGNAWSGKLMMDKAAALPAKIGARAVREAYRSTGLLDEVAAHYKAWAQGVDLGKPRGERFNVGALTPELVDFLAAKGYAPDAAAISLGDKQLSHARRDVKNSPLPEQDWLRLPGGLDKPLAVLWDLQSLKAGHAPALVYVYAAEGGGYAKVVVEIGYRAKDTVAGKKGKIATNAVVTAGLADLPDLKNTGVFELAQGALP